MNKRIYEIARDRRN